MPGEGSTATQGLIETDYGGEMGANAEVEEDVMTGIVEWINEVIADMGDDTEMGGGNRRSMG